MLRQLLSIFRSDNPLRAMGDNFAQMLEITNELTIKAGDMFFGEPATPEERTWIYKQDVKVNKLERTIRKQVIAHLSIQGNSPNLPYCLFLMSLVKDVERIGDYAKNLSEVVDLHEDQLPEDELVAELREIRTNVERVFAETTSVFAAEDDEGAVELIRQGRDLTHRCDMLITKVARSSYSAAVTTAVVLGTRYYKRIAAHLLNILSSLVMPLHKLDFYDEDEVPSTIRSTS